MNFQEIKTYEDACKGLGITPEEDLPYAEPASEKEIFLNAASKLETIAKALNDGWEPNWDDRSEFKHTPYFDMRSGFGFSGTDSSYWDTLSDVGSRLVFKTAELAEYAGKQFESIYRELMVK